MLPYIPPQGARPPITVGARLAAKTMAAIRQSRPARAVPATPYPPTGEQCSPYMLYKLKITSYQKSRTAWPLRFAVLLSIFFYCTVVATWGAPPASSSAVSGRMGAMGVSSFSRATASISLMRFSWFTRVALGS